MAKTAPRKPTKKPARTKKPAARKPAPKKAAPKLVAHKQEAPKKPETAAPVSPPLDLEKLAENMGVANELWQRIMQTGAAKAMNKSAAMGHTDPLSMAESMFRAARQMTVDPNKFAQAQLGYVNDQLKLWQWWTGKMLGRDEAALVEPAPRDRRFSDAAWSGGAADLIKQSYLLNARWLENFIDTIEGVDPQTEKKIRFYTRQFIDAASPSNFALSNPQVLQTMMETNGESIVKGLTNLLSDLEKDAESFRISMTDESAFTLGKNIATSEGQVVYQNELMQLIQYAPTTKQVHEVPILLVPAWINKYYILDLAPGRSLAEWLTNQGYTVFVISWANPDESLGRKKFDDYLRQGPLAALDVIEEITKSKKTAMAGYCLGGTLTAITLSYLRAHGQEKRVASASYLTTLVDFAEAGDISVFIDDTQLDALEGRMESRGYLDAGDMSATFNMLRANDLIWSFVVNNYLLGKTPYPFDLLYWNADATRMPSTMHAFYLRNMYQQNNLIKPNGIHLLDTPINLNKITTPSYVFATREDHIAPWKSCYLATQTYDGECVFTLADSGHVAGVINPPTKQKYCYWTNSTLTPKAEDWFAGAKEHPGSWWPHWEAWQRKFAGKKVAARKPGSSKHKPREAAPGSYAKVKA